MLFGSKKLIGLDIGSSTIKIAELDVSKRGASLLSFAVTATPPQAMEAGELVQIEPISAAVRDLIQLVRSKRKSMAVGLWGSSVIVKRITVPKMEEDLLTDQIRWEAEQYIPYDINTVNLEFKVLRQKSVSDTMDVLLVAAVQDSVYKCVELVEAAGLKCDILDIEGFALANCFEKNYGRYGTQATALLNIGGSVTNFVVVEEGEVVFCRDIPVGGGTYTLELNKGMGISLAEAEAMKISAANGQPVPQEVTDILSSTHDIVCDEINSSVDFFLNTSSTDSITQAYVTGGGSKTPGLMEVLSRMFRVERLNPFTTVSAKNAAFKQGHPQEMRDFCAIAIGLGLRKIGDT